jgi:RsiW-degrading membrane proteinase PrsW (M82 family)
MRCHKRIILGNNFRKMKNKTLIIVVSFVAVIICLIFPILLLYSVQPKFLVILSFTVGIIAGALITLLIISLIGILKNKRSK